MKFNELDSSAHKRGSRVGRGIAAGRGKTAGRGTKGQKSRTGSAKKPGFEGGSNPLMQRLPKLHGFRSYAIKAEVIKTGQIAELASAKIDNFSLFEAGLISSPYVRVKVLLGGDLKKKTTVKLQAASAGAEKAIKAAGGEFNQVPQVKRESKKSREAPKTAK